MVTWCRVLTRVGHVINFQARVFGGRIKQAAAEHRDESLGGQASTYVH